MWVCSVCVYVCESVRLDERAQLIQDVLGVAKKHLIVVIIKNGVVKACIPHSHASLEKDGLLRLPHPQNLFSQVCVWR